MYFGNKKYVIEFIFTRFPLQENIEFEIYDDNINIISNSALSTIKTNFKCYFCNNSVIKYDHSRKSWKKLSLSTSIFAFVPRLFDTYEDAIPELKNILRDFSFICGYFSCCIKKIYDRSCKTTTTFSNFDFIIDPQYDEGIIKGVKNNNSFITYCERCGIICKDITYIDIKHKKSICILCLKELLEDYFKEADNIDTNILTSIQSARLARKLI
jgi:hypothetical protein